MIKPAPQVAAPSPVPGPAKPAKADDRQAAPSAEATGKPGKRAAAPQAAGSASTDEN